MAKGKKTKKDKQRSRLKLAVRKQRENQSVTSRTRSSFNPVEMPAVADIDVPEGFRAVTTTQAVMEYGQPVMDLVEEGNTDGLSAAMNLVMQIWNYTNMLEEGTHDDKLTADISRQLISTFRMDKKDVQAFLNRMVERKNHLLPQDIQPEFTRYSFIRKEVSHIIPRFDYDANGLSDELLPPDDDDSKLIDMIRQMDRNIADRVDYSDYEKFCMDMEQKCREQYGKWLTGKGLDDELACDLSSNIELFLDFVYRYLHEDVVTLEYVPPDYLAEFFMDFVMRKVVTKPHMYVRYPATVKYVYRFLSEKGYAIKQLDETLNFIDETETQFLKMLREQFG